MQPGNTILVPKFKWLPTSETFIADELSGFRRLLVCIWYNKFIKNSYSPNTLRTICDKPWPPFPWFSGLTQQSCLDSIIDEINPLAIYFELGMDAFHLLAGHTPIKHTIPIVCALRGADTSKYVVSNNVNYSLISNQVHLFLCRSQEMLDRCIRLGIPKTKLKVVRSGIRLDRFITVEHSYQISPVFVSCCRLVSKKGLDDLIKAAQIMINSDVRSFRIDVYGEGREKEELLVQAAPMIKAGIFRFLGPILPSEVPKVLANATAVVQPSKTSPDGNMEGIPVVIMEALACKTPVISTWHAGIPELVSHNEWGILVPPCSPQKLAEALTRFVQEPNLFRDNMDDARHFVGKNHSAEIQATEVEDIVLDLCK